MRNTKEDKMLIGASVLLSIPQAIKSDMVVQYTDYGFKHVYNKLTGKLHVRENGDPDTLEPYWTNELVNAVKNGSGGIHKPFKGFLEEKNSAGFKRLA